MKSWLRFQAWWVQRNRREQAVLLLAALVLCLAALDRLAWTPAVAERARLLARMDTGRVQRRTFEQQAALQQLQRAVSQREEAALRQRLARAEQQIVQIRQAVTPPGEMVQRLREISGQDSKVRLVGLVAEPAEPLFKPVPTVAHGAAQSAAERLMAQPAALRAAPRTDGAPDTPAAPAPGTAAPAAAAAASAIAKGAARAPTLYRLPVLVTLEGDYTSLHDYLASLEASGTGLRWRSLELQAEHWPTLRLKLRVFTIGEQPTWQL
jgi:TolA-binding protein